MVFANQYGLKRTVKFCFGVSVGFFVIMVICSYFNLFLKNVIPKIELLMSIVGSFYMLYLAFKIIKSKPNDQNKSEDKNNTFFAGMILQFVNPKAILYGITVISTFIIPYHSSNSSLIMFSLFLAVIGFMSTFSWSIFGSLFQRLLSKYRSRFNIVMALLLIYSAVSILV